MKLFRRTETLASQHHSLAHSCSLFSWEASRFYHLPFTIFTILTIFTIGRPPGLTIFAILLFDLTILLNQALVLPRTTILLLLFLTAFIWIAVGIIFTKFILRRFFVHSFLTLCSIQLQKCSCRILYLPAGDLDASPGGSPEVHHLGSLPILPPPPRHHHLLHHPHLHDGPGQRGKWTMFGNIFDHHGIFSTSSPANGRRRPAVRMGKNPRSKATGAHSTLFRRRTKF